MGNMGNPVSTRLGINQFWYKHWYNDTSKLNDLKQDDSLEKLISFYIQYGLSFHTNPFLHEYWYKKNLKNIRTVVQHKLNSRFFRRFYYTNDALSIEHSYLIRNKTPEFFPMRTWILKYSGWVIFSIQWFKPQKTKLISSKYASSSYVGAVSKAPVTKKLTTRVKLLILYLSRNYNYTF